MKKSWVIAKKEFVSYFHSPGGYIILVVLLAIFNTFFYVILDQNREATLRDMFALMEFMFVFVVPLLTMHLLAAERRNGTLELLKTSPITETDIVLGKFLGAGLFLLVLILCTLSYYVILEIFSSPDRMTTLCGYLGLILEGGLFLAIGLMTSSLTKNHVIAAIVSYGILFCFYFSISFIKYLPDKLGSVIQYLSFWDHTRNLSSGLLTIADIFYSLSGTIFFLFLTQIFLAKE